MNKYFSSLFLYFLVFTLVSCGQEEIEHTIPQAAVNFSVNLNGNDQTLDGGYSVKTFTAARLSGEFVGFSGLLVFNDALFIDGLPSLKAYDLCCPYEGMREIKVTPNNEGKATCSKCKSVYDLSTGAPLSGPASKRLQEYSVSRVLPYQGIFRIWN